MAFSLSQNVLNMSLVEVSQALKTKKLSVVELAEKALKQEKLTSTLNAFISLAPQDRLQQKIHEAQKRQETNSQLSALDGIPIAVKDNYCTSWMKTTCASHILSNYLPPYDATLVTRLEAAGAIIIGKTNMDEFAMGSAGVNSVHGPTKNLFRSGLGYSVPGLQQEICGSLPNEEWLVSGGSSGGSAVAVASSVVFGGIGSDTGGSVRNPASLCGVVGLKPSYGALSRHGLISLVNSLDVPGVLARSCQDCTTIMEVLVAPDTMDSTNRPLKARTETSDVKAGVSGLVVGVPVEYHCEGLHPTVLQQWQTVADLLDSNGAKVVPVSLPHSKYVPYCYTILNTVEVASNFTRYTGVQYGVQVPCDHSMEAQYALTRAAGLSQVVRDRVLAGNYFLLRTNKEKYLNKAMKIRRLISEDFKKVFESGVDMLLTPTTLFPAVRPDLYSVKNYSELTYLQDLCTCPANLTGVPALSIPVGYTQLQNNNQQHKLSPTQSPNEFGSNTDVTTSTSTPGEGFQYSEHYSSSEHIPGLPLSVQLMSPYGTDWRLLAVGRWLEESLSIPRAQLALAS